MKRNERLDREFAKQLKAQKPAIIDQWVKLVIADPAVPTANRLGKPMLVDHMPDIIESIIAALEVPPKLNGIQSTDGTEATHKHAETRAWQGYDVPEAIVELAHLRDVIISACGPDLATLSSLSVVHEIIDQAMIDVALEIETARRTEHRGRLESDERLRLFFANVKDFGIFSTDATGHIKDWSESAKSLLGYEESEIVGLNFQVLFTHEDIVAKVPELELANAAVSGMSSEKRWYVKKNRARIWATGSTTALKDESGTVFGYTKIFRDETDRMREEVEKDRMVEELRRLDRMKDVFLATLSHELRTPLNVVGGYVELLKDGFAQEDSSLVEDAIKAIERNIAIQIKIVSDLLDISRILAGKFQIELRPLEIEPVIEAAVAVVRGEATKKRVKLRLSCDSLVSPIMGDSSRLQQIIWNLLTNAIKFSPEGETVDIDVRKKSDLVEIIVTDRGRGIHPELLPYIFDRFRQSEDEVNKRHGGLGLGLALVRQLVELHGGTVEAHSAGEGLGAAFEVHLPALIINPVPSES